MASAMLSDCASSAASRLLPLQGTIRTKALYLHRSIPWLRMAVPGRSRSTAALPHWRLSDISPVSMATETSAKIIDGKSVAKQIRDEIAGEIAKMKDAIGKKPVKLWVSHLMKSIFLKDSTEEEVLKHISSFNIDPSVHGILVQLPLPRRENVTVSIIHSYTKNPEEIARQADAAGVANLVRGSWIKPGAVVIDVRIKPVDDADSPPGYWLVGGLL